MALRILTNGEVIVASGLAGRVISATGTTNASGVVSFASPYAGAVVRAKARKCPTPVRSLVATADPYFRCALLQQLTDLSRVAVIVRDPYWGQKIGAWTKNSVAWSAAMPMGSMYSVKLTKDGASQVGEWIDLVPRWNTQADGVISGAWEPSFPYASLVWNAGLGAWVDGGNDLGRFKTSTGGWARWFDPSNQTYRDIIVPTGWGAWGQKPADSGWANGPEPEARLSGLYAYWKQVPRLLTADASATLSVQLCNLKIVGATSGQVVAWWEDTFARANAATNASGVARFSQLVPGQYSIAQYHLTNFRKGTARIAALLSMATGSHLVNLPTTWESAAVGGDIVGIIYAHGATPCSGAVLIQLHETSGVYKTLDTTDAAGVFGCSTVGTADIIVTHPTWGDGRIVHGGQGFWADFTLAGCLGGTPLGGADECLSPWSNRGVNSNLPAPLLGAYIRNTKTTDKYWLRQPTAGHGIVSDPAPRWRHSGAWSVPVTKYRYDIYGADDVVIASGFYLDEDDRPVWAQGANWYQQSTEGDRLSQALGGKAWGNLVAYSNDKLSGVLAEAERMGAEWGRLDDLYVRVRPRLSTATSTYKAQALTGMQCPFCQGPLAVSPDDAVGRGYCLNANCGLDGRTYFQTPAVRPASTWAMRVIAQKPGDHAHRLLEWGYRPEDYQENDDYIQLVGAHQRWTAGHIGFGTWSGAAWTDGENISQVAASQGRTIGPCRLKAIVQAAYTGSACAFKLNLLRADNVAETQVLTLPADAAAGTWLAVNRNGPCHMPEATGYNAKTGYYLDVTNVTALQTPGNAHFTLVNVAPHVNTVNGVGISTAHATPYLADLDAGVKRHPDLWHGPWDRTYLAWVDDQKRVNLQKSEDTGRTWTQPATVTPTGWTYPAVCKTIKGDLLVTATDTGETKTKVWKSRSDGSTFASLAMSLAGTRMGMMTGMGPRKYGVLLDGGQQELRETVTDFSTTLSRPSALAGGGSSLKTSTVITTDAGNARAAILRDPKCNLFAALVNDASHVKVWRSRENGFGWASCARSFVGVEADATLGAGPKAYLVARSGGTLRWYRGLRQLSTVLDSAIIATDVDAERPAVWKLNSRGREALAAVTVGGTVRIYGSRDDGKTWSQKA